MKEEIHDVFQNWDAASNDQGCFLNDNEFEDWASELPNQNISYSGLYAVGIKLSTRDWKGKEPRTFPPSETVALLEEEQRGNVPMCKYNYTEKEPDSYEQHQDRRFDTKDIEIKASQIMSKVTPQLAFRSK